MKKIEITTRVNQNLNEIDTILTSQGFSMVRKSRVEDHYMTMYFDDLNKDNIIDILKKSVLIRYLCENNKDIYKRITYKSKEYKDNNVLTEKKYSVMIDSTKKAKSLFEALGFKKIVDVKYDVIVYKKDEIEFAFQDVEGLGLLVEYENNNDFENKSSDEILNEKRNMLEIIRSFNIDADDDFDVKKAYELIKNKLK